jgi:UDP-N-acetylglucosamine 2-epimerase
MREVIAHYRQGIDSSKALEQLNLTPRGYLVVSAHREENVDVPQRLAQLVECVNALATTHDMPVVFSVHPRTRKRLDAAPRLELDRRVRAMAPLGFLDYAKLQMESFCVVSDSGSITEESSILGFPAVTMRQAHERPEGMDEGTLVMCEHEHQIGCARRCAWSRTRCLPKRQIPCPAGLRTRQCLHQGAAHHPKLRGLRAAHRVVRAGGVPLSGTVAR